MDLIIKAVGYSDNLLYKVRGGCSAELLQQFKAVEQFTDDDKNVVKKLIDAFIVKKQLQLMAS